MSFLIIPGVILGALLLIMVVFLLVYKKMYIKATNERAFIRTGSKRPLVVINGGAFVIKGVFHDMIWVNMKTHKIIIKRANEDAFTTKDRMKVDMTVEFYLRVKAEEESILTAAQTLGQKTEKVEELKELVDGKFVQALRSAAAKMAMNDIHENRVGFKQEVEDAVNLDIEKNGLELESVSLTGFRQTDIKYFNPNDEFDAEGLRRLTAKIEQSRVEKNSLECEAETNIKERNLEAKKRSLDIDRARESAELEQVRELQLSRSNQETEIAKSTADKKREAREAEINAEESTQKVEIDSKLRIDESQMASAKAVATARIKNDHEVNSEMINRDRDIEIAKKDKDIVLAAKDEEAAAARARSNEAKIEEVKTEEGVITAKDVAEAERDKQISILSAETKAEQDSRYTIIAAKAEAEATREKAQAELDGTKLTTEAETLKITVESRRLEVEAQGVTSMNAAKNTMSTDQISLETQIIITSALPSILEAAAKPMEKIDSIKIAQVSGLGGVGTSVDGEGTPSNGGGLPNQLVQALSQYRVNVPLIDGMMKDLGLSNGIGSSGLSEFGLLNQPPVNHDEAA